MDPLKNVAFSSIDFIKKVIFIIWLLVFSKCFILEYYIIEYQLPINSHFYIWTLSLLLVSTVSYLFWNRSKNTYPSKVGFIKKRSLINFTLLLSFIMFSLMNYFLLRYNSQIILSLLLTLFALYLLNNGFFLSNLMQIISGTVSLISVYPIFNTTTPKIYLFTSILLILNAIPFIVEIIVYRKFSKKPIVSPWPT